MATLQELLNQASEIRDAELEGENTAVRVGTMLINIIEHIGQFVTSTQLEQTLRDVSNGMEEWLEKYAQIDSNSGLLDFNHSWFVPLATMGPAYDESTEEYTPAIGEIYYKEQSGYRIFVRTSSSGNIGYPAKVGVVYLNKRTGKWYKWNGDSMVKLPGGGDSGEVVNDLVTGGADIPLSAEMGKRLKTKIDEVQANIQRLYNNLGNIAFWDAAAKAAAAPVAIDWGNPKHTVTLDLDLTNAVAKHDGVTKSDGDTILVEEGSTLNIIVEPDSGYMLTDNNISSSTAGVDVTPLGNGAYSVAIVMRQSNLTLSISAEAAEVLLLNATMNLKGFTAESEPTPTYRQQYQVVLNLDKYYFPLGTYPDVYYPSPYDSILREQVSVMVGNTDITNNPGVKSVRADGKELTITIPAEGVTDDIIITARAQCYVYYGKGMDNNNQISYSNGALILPYLKVYNGPGGNAVIEPRPDSTRDVKTGIHQYILSEGQNTATTYNYWTDNAGTSGRSVNISENGAATHIRLFAYQNAKTFLNGTFVSTNGKRLFDTTDGIYKEDVEWVAPAASELPPYGNEIFTPPQQEEQQ